MYIQWKLREYYVVLGNRKKTPKIIMHNNSNYCYTKIGNYSIEADAYRVVLRVPTKSKTCDFPKLEYIHVRRPVYTVIFELIIGRVMQCSVENEYCTTRISFIRRIFAQTHW